MIANLPGFPDNVLAFSYSGHITKADYDDVLLPAVHAALEKPGKLRVYCEVAPGFSGFDPASVWEDLRTGLSHLTRWERVAVVTDVKWLEHTTQFFNLMLPVLLRSFATSDTERARAWVIAAV